MCFAATLTAQPDETMKYERSSLYSVLINHENQQFSEDISETFLQIPTPDKYNNHDLNVKIVNVPEKKLGSNALSLINAWVDNNHIASRMLARWFNRNYQTGVCDVDLVKERGLYNASELDKELAERTKRGKAMLEDAGENLIGKTFLIVNDITYIDRAKGSSTAGSIFGGLASGLGAALGSAYGISSLSSLGDAVGNLGDAMISSYKGFKVNIHTYLYQLEWNDEVAATFYTDYWTDTPSEQKVRLFNENRSLFHMKYIGDQFSDGSNTSFMGVNEQKPQLMVRKACQRAIDENIANLQKNYDVFKVKTPLVVRDGVCTAYIGKKEGVTAHSKYEVLEVREDADGRRTYKRVATLTPQPDKIWDNRFMAQEEGAEGAELGYTTFTRQAGDNLTTGMLIREIR